MQEKSVLPDLNQDIYRRILTLIVRQKKNDLNEVMKEHAGSGYRNLFAKSVFFLCFGNLNFNNYYPN